SLNAIVHDSLAAMQTDLRERQIEVDLKLDEELPPVSVDALQIGQVIVNLVRNAIEAMDAAAPQKRQLSLSTAAPDAAVELTIRDTGPGLTKGLMKQLFLPFQTTKPKGMGLGLAISRSIAQAHGGRLWAGGSTSNGATFHLSLPLNGEQLLRSTKRDPPYALSRMIPMFGKLFVFVSSLME